MISPEKWCDTKYRALIIILVKVGQSNCSNFHIIMKKGVIYMKQYYVYLTTNLINNKKYIGCHYGELDDDYLGSGTIL